MYLIAITKLDDFSLTRRNIVLFIEQESILLFEQELDIWITFTLIDWVKRIVKVAKNSL